MEIVHYGQTVFVFELPSLLLVTRYDEFIKKFAYTSVQLLVKLYFSVLLLCFIDTVMVNKDKYNNQWEWEGNGNKTRLNLGLGMGMNRWEWEGMGLKKTFPVISTCESWMCYINTSVNAQC